jgi:serine-type D-Ala-D-Ala carboxypeptidase/endopeptidase (penicillin-binding protein 4)
MTRIGTLLLVIGHLFFASAGAQQPAPATADSLEALQQRISALITQPRYASAMWGVKVISLDTKKILFEYNPQKLFSPASNSKLYTMALALDRLGPDYRIRTSLYARARPNRRGILDGDLIVYGRGDPTINTRLHTNIYEALEPLVAALSNAGVKRISGDLIGDDSCFRGPPFGSGWDWGDLQNYYGAEVSALTINDNTLQVFVKPGDHLGQPCQVSIVPPTAYLAISNRTFTVLKGARRAVHFYRPIAENVLYITGEMAIDDTGSTEDATVHSPAGLFVRFFQEALAKSGIEVAGHIRTMNWLDRENEPLDLKESVELGSMKSPPFLEILPEILKPSQNLYTDLLLAHVGTMSTNAPPSRRGAEETTEDIGVRALREFLAEAKLPGGQTFMEEGSGLSRNNLTSPNATVALLEYMSRHKYSDLFINSLPVAGVDGTLRRRMKGTAAEGKVRAKTGTLGWANSLSGYVTTASGEHLAFSIMLNRFENSDPNRPKTTDIDAIAVMLASYAGK